MQISFFERLKSVRNDSRLSLHSPMVSIKKKIESLIKYCIKVTFAFKWARKLPHKTVTYESAKCVPCNTRKCTHNGFVSELLKWALKCGFYATGSWSAKMINVDMLNSASRILQCWSCYVKNNSARHQQELKTERDWSHRQLFLHFSCPRENVAFARTVP